MTIPPTDEIVEPLARALRAMMHMDPLDDSRRDFGDMQGGALLRPSEVATALAKALAEVTEYGL